ncbi:MAG TPA: hypothetical protein VKD23_17710 [Terriglobales bacterium]|nr:hypothetical protein [Terriglobales bacterium]
MPRTRSNEHRLHAPNGLQSDGTIEANESELPLSGHHLIRGLKLHPSIDCSEMLLQPLFLGLFQA